MKKIKDRKPLLILQKETVKLLRSDKLELVAAGMGSRSHAVVCPTCSSDC